MSITETPCPLAAETEADLVECAENLFMSIPDCNRISFTHLATVAEDTGLCGFLTDRSSGLLPSFFFSKMIC